MLREALRPNRARRQVVSSPKPIPAPTKGWFARENDMDMPRGSAKLLRNWWPQPDTVSLRKGAKGFATGMPGPVRSVMAYRSAALSKLFAASVSGIYDVTAGGAVGGSVRPITESRMSHINVATSGGQFLLTVNGADAPAKYDGTNWTAINILSGGPTSINDLNFVWAYRSRVYFLAKNSTRFYFLPADSIGGTLNVFEVGASLSRGGKLIAAGVWAVDSGLGPDDLMAVVSDEGEVIVYRGVDPSLANSWERIGVYTIGKPIGPRCLESIGGELVVLCDDGAVPLSTIVKIDRAEQKKAATTSNIDKAFNDAIRERGRGIEWQIKKWSAGNMLICNLPAVPQGGEQYAMNTQHGAWTYFQGVNAICWEEFNDVMYYGAPDGRVMQFWHGSTDDGASISALAVTSFSNLNYGGLKTASLLRTTMKSSDVVTVKVGISVDYDVNETALVTLDFDAASSIWDVAPWDTSDWADDDVVRRQAWQGVSGVGYVFAAMVGVSTVDLGPDYNIDCQLIAFDLVAANGGIL